MLRYTSRNVLIFTLLAQSAHAACPDNCNSCDESDRCTSCKTGHWGLDIRCQHTCADNCLDKDCNATNGYCLACKPGLYGFQCWHNCCLCEDGLCNLVDCRKGCKPGYYEFRDNAEMLCFPCSADCRSCINNTVCSVCNDGFYLYKREQSGKIIVQCLLCSLGASCSSSCAMQNCNQCQVVGGSLLCTRCIDEYRFNGDICIPNDNNCAQGCSTDCDVDRKCLGSCTEGWTGQQCSEPCASQCLKCDKNNANICQECKGDFYTENCNIDCNPSCIKLSGIQTCRLTDGYCNNGCKNIYFGQFCNQYCSYGCVDDGESVVCYRDNGTCRNGCRLGYNGDNCDTKASEKPTTRSEANSEEVSTTTATAAATTTTTTTIFSAHCQGDVKGTKDTCFVFGYLSGFGTAVFVVAVTAVLYRIRRRYISRKSKTDREGPETTDTSTYYNETAEQTAAVEMTDKEANSYESLGSNRNTDKVYTELERPSTQKSEQYYNTVVTK